MATVGAEAPPDSPLVSLSHDHLHLPFGESREKHSDTYGVNGENSV